MSAESRIYIIEWRGVGTKRWVMFSYNGFSSEAGANEVIANLRNALWEYRAVAYVRETERKG